MQGCVVERSQIKQALDGVIQLRRFKDFEKSSRRHTILRHLLTQSQIKGAPDCIFFRNAVSALFSSERHRTDIGWRPDGHQAASISLNISGCIRR